MVSFPSDSLNHKREICKGGTQCQCWKPSLLTVYMFIIYCHFIHVLMLNIGDTVAIYLYLQLILVDRMDKQHIHIQY